MLPLAEAVPVTTDLSDHRPAYLPNTPADPPQSVNPTNTHSMVSWLLGVGPKLENSNLRFSYNPIPTLKQVMAHP